MNPEFCSPDSSSLISDVQQLINALRHDAERYRDQVDMSVNPTDS